jgi:hypothetical protein
MIILSFHKTYTEELSYLDGQEKKWCLLIKLSSYGMKKRGFKSPFFI